MSRRDTILMAVLINAGLLILLFSTAITTEPPSQAFVIAETKSKAISQVEPIIQPKVREELDRVIAAHQAQAKPSPDPLPEEIKPLQQVVQEVVGETSIAQGAKYVDIVVKKGDNLDKLARANGTSILAIEELNSLTTTRLQIGQELRIPLSEPLGSRTVGPVEVELATERFYTIRSGDNPWSIAMKQHIPLDELLKMNNLDEERARRLKPGDRIRIR